MGSELKALENCENIIRNRKQKTTHKDEAEKLTKVKKQTNLEKSDHQQKDEIAKKDSKPSSGSTETEKQELLKGEQQISPRESIKFTIKIEFDPMSIALFTLALVTRFFRLSEPRNVV
jgi:hypothetical protein